MRIRHGLLFTNVMKFKSEHIKTKILFHNTVIQTNLHKFEKKNIAKDIWTHSYSKCHGSANAATKLYFKLPKIHLLND